MSWYSQRDPQWASQRLGTVDSVTIGSDGCFVTAFANLANDCGKDITPAALDDIFTNQNMYVGGDLCTDDMLTRVYPDIVYRGSQSYDGPADLSQLNNDVTVKQILEVDGQPNTPGLQTHFVYFYSYVNGIVWVIDSWTGLLINLASVYGDPAICIYKIVTYSYAPAAPTPTPAPPVDPAQELPPPHDPVSQPTPVPDPISAPVAEPQPPVDPTPAEPVLVPPATLLPGPLPPPEVPVDAFIGWLLNLISKLFFWRKGR